MATVLYQSTTNAGNATGSVSVSKPASLAVGDLLIAQATAQTATGTPSISAPAGWTQITQAVDSVFYVWAAFYKVASSSDVAASSFTFTTTADGPGGMIVYVSRFKNNDTNNPINQISNVASGASGTTTLTLSDSGFTPSSPMGTLVTLECTLQSGGAPSVSGYVSANNNPTWTEAYDVFAVYIGGIAGGLAMAYASYPNKLNTGNISATITASSSPISAARLVSFYIIPPEVDVLSMTSSTLKVESIRIILMNQLSVISSLISPAINIVISKWNNIAKHTSNWINRAKS